MTARTRGFHLPRVIPALISTCLTIGCGGTNTGDSSVDEELVRSELFPEPTNNGLRAFGPGKPSDAEAVAPDAEEDELVSKGFLMRTAQSNAEIFQWSTPGDGARRADVLLRPKNTHVCFLTRVSGNLGGQVFVGAMSIVGVHKSTVDFNATCGTQGSAFIVNDASDIWKLGGCQLTSNSLTAEATCVPGANFIVDAGGVVLGSEVSSVAAESEGGDCHDVSSVGVANAAAVSWLTAVQGYFNGSGEVLEIVPGSSTALTRLRAETNTCGERGDVQGGSYSMFAGVLGRATKRWSRISISVPSKGKKKISLIAATRGNVCYLTRISGKFDGSPERVRIFPEVDATGTERWMLEATAGDEGRVYATAECIPYDQRDGSTPL